MLRTLFVLATALALGRAAIPNWKTVADSCSDDPDQGNDAEKARCCGVRDEIAHEGKFLSFLLQILLCVLGDQTGYCTGNGEKFSCAQAEPPQAVKSAVVLFYSISCATSCLVTQYCFCELASKLNSSGMTFAHFVTFLGSFICIDQN